MNSNYNIEYLNTKMSKVNHLLKEIKLKIQIQIMQNRELRIHF